MELGFVGLGRMGSAMAANLLEAPHALAVHNRTAAKTAPACERRRHARQNTRTGRGRRGRHNYAGGRRRGGSRRFRLRRHPRCASARRNPCFHEHDQCWACRTPRPCPRREGTAFRLRA
ncbi:MAG TPA: NAD(P)-binding domain-containing protein [Methyloceanibacter sp.]|nr:NAD(P)-binding domain-containing protein [Methyloceanibacter sp.]